MLKDKKIWFFSLAIFVFQAMLLFYLYEKNANSDVSEALARNNNRFDCSFKAINQSTNDLFGSFSAKVKKFRHGKEAYLLSEDIRKEEHELYGAMDSILVILEKEGKISPYLSDTTQQNIKLFYADLEGKLGVYYEKLMPIFKEKTDKDAIETTHFLERMKKSKIKILDLTKNISIPEHELVLRKLQADVATASFMCVHYLDASVQERPQYLFDKFEAAVVLDRKRVQQGEDLNAAIYLAASSSMAEYTVSVKGKELPTDKNGMATYKEKATKTGTFGVEASITRTRGWGGKSTIRGELKYEVVDACNN